MPMRVGQLIRELSQYPKSWEVWMEVQGKEGIVEGVDMVSGGISAWLLLTDYPQKEEEVGKE